MEYLCFGLWRHNEDIRRFSSVYLTSLLELHLDDPIGMTLTD